MLDYTLVDDFFDNVDDIRKYALSLNYNKSFNELGCNGFRIQTNKNELLEFIKLKLFEINDNFKFLKLRVYFHYSTEDTKNEFKNFDINKLHKDESEWAGVIYLTPNPKQNSGTVLCDDYGKVVHNIENKYNRFIFYRGDTLHGVSDTFGDNIENSRLTITIFGDKMDKTNNTLI